MSDDYDNNFLTEEVLDDTYEESYPPTTSDEQTAVVLTEAVKRMEQAKLYEVVLKHELFSPGSARPEILKTVQNEVRSFALDRLEILLGMKSSAPTQSAEVSIFSAEEIQALKALAGKLLNRQQQEARVTTPTINQVGAAPVQPVSSPGINTIGGSQPASAPKSQQARKPRTPKAKSGNVSPTTGQDYSQAVNPSRPPLRMPSQAEIDSMNARTAASNSGTNKIGGPAGALDRMMSAAIVHAQNQNRNIKEE